MTHNLTAETITITGHNGDEIEAYAATPTDATQVGSIVVIHHLPGYDEATKEIARKFAANGFAAVMPNLYHRIAPGADPDDAAAAARAQGGVSDEQLVGDVGGAMEYLKSLTVTNGKVAVIGYCSGGRQSFLAGCRLPFDAVIDCYGAFVAIDPPSDFPITLPKVIDEAPNLSGPVLGLFGAEDQYPSPEQTEIMVAAMAAAGKEFEQHTYEGAGHAFFAVNRPAYRVEAANDGWEKIFAFLTRTVA